MSDNSYRDDYQRTRPRSVTALVRVAQAEDGPHWFAKLLALGLLLLCLGLGLVGLILPLVPGLLFFAFAAMIVGSMFPSIGERMRSTPWLTRWVTPYLDTGAGFSRFSWQGKLKFMLWITARVLVDSFLLLWAALARVVGFFGKDKPRFD